MGDDGEVQGNLQTHATVSLHAMFRCDNNITLICRNTYEYQFSSFVANSRYQAAKHEIIAWKEGKYREFYSSDGGGDVKARVKQLVYMSILQWMSLEVMVARPFGIAAR